MEIFGASAMEEALDGESAEISGRLSLKGYDAGSALSRIWRAFTGRFKQEIHASLGSAVKLVALIILCAFSCSICEDEKIRGFVEICGACAAALGLVGHMSGLISQTLEAIYRLSDYSKAALPVVYTAAAASGAVSSAAVRYAASCLALDMIMSLSQKAVIPLIYANLALSITGVIFPNSLLAATEKLSKWAAKTVMTGATVAFTSYLGMTAVISTSVDAAAVKTAKSVITSALPVVGGMISSASAAVLSAAAVVRSCTGVFGLVSVCAICVGPFALLSVKNLLFKAVAAVADSVQSPRLQRLFSGIGSAVGMLMGLLGSGAIMLFLSFALAMKAVSGG